MPHMVMKWGGVTIGDNFFMGTNSALCGNRGNITIGNNVMIASNCVILKYVVLKKGSVVAAGAVVNKTFDEYSVIGGVPAKLIKKRK
ncbi:2,3,4,5-tetrahydropyridine-2,6-dicarboxylate N-acetyltransferase [Campylobacter hyointestinalis]|nr:2,3,4,5-tetrahydropyridine-2,6-dicarboxylate N-acetyltransferase [Campylobacter hyointestinalis]